MNSLVFCLLCVLALVSVLAGATPCSALVSAYYFYQPLPTCPALFTFISHDCPTPIQGKFFVIPDYQQLSHQLAATAASAQLLTSTMSAQCVALGASIVFASIGAAVLVMMMVMHRSVKTVLSLKKSQVLGEVLGESEKPVECEQCEDDKNSENNKKTEENIEAVPIHHQASSADDEICLMPLTTAAEPLKKMRLVGFGPDDVSWDGYTLATLAKLHQKISDGAGDEEQLAEFERDAPVNADPPLEPQPQKKKLTYADVNWDKYPYAARAQIFYKITNECMTADDLLAFDCAGEAENSLHEEFDECGSIRTDVAVESFSIQNDAADENGSMQDDFADDGGSVHVLDEVTDDTSQAIVSTSSQLEDSGPLSKKPLSLPMKCNGNNYPPPASGLVASDPSNCHDRRKAQDSGPIWNVSLAPDLPIVRNAEYWDGLSRLLNLSNAPLDSSTVDLDQKDLADSTDSTDHWKYDWDGCDDDYFHWQERHYSVKFLAGR